MPDEPDQTPPDLSAVNAVLSDHLTLDAEWQAYQARAARVLLKRKDGKPLNREEETIILDIKAAAELTEPPKSATGENLPPIFYSYDDAAGPLGVDRNFLMRARASGCPAFTGKMIFTATFLAWVALNPEPKHTSNHSGRRLKLTPALQAKIVKELAICPVLKIVAQANGLDPSTLNAWRTRGMKGEKPFALFYHETEAAIAGAKTTMLRDIVTDPDWRAKMTVLERIDPDTFGKRTEITGPQGGPIPTSVAPIIVQLAGVTENPYAPPAATLPTK